MSFPEEHLSLTAIFCFGTEYMGLYCQYAGLAGKNCNCVQNEAKSGVPVRSKAERMASLAFPQVFDNRKKRFCSYRQGGKAQGHPETALASALI
jgi:hypothetical protein